MTKQKRGSRGAGKAPDPATLADAIGRLAAGYGELTPEERELQAVPVALMLRETAQVAYQAGGSVPWAWSHYLMARRAFASDSALADALGVNRSRVARWKQGERPEPENEAGLRDLGVVVSLLTGYLEDDAIPDWLHGMNPHLGHRRPLDVLRTGRLSEVVQVIEAEQGGAFA